MLPFLSLHALAAQSGDGLRPELLALFARRAGSQTGLSARIEPDETTSSDTEQSIGSGASVSRGSDDESSTSSSCHREGEQ
jgi:hypothetical protein